jgi:DNA-binding SARP family transcriptional activator
MDALWPQLAPEAAAANLRKAVHFARRALGSDDAIEATGSELALLPGGEIHVDVARFEEAADHADGSAEAAEAAELYPGDLLPADLYESWTEEPRARLRRLFVQVLKTAGEWERVLEVEHADEEAHRALIRSQLDAGRRTEAVRQFERLRAVLRDELGLAPEPETVRLYERVLGMDDDEPPSAAERAQALLAWGLVHWNRRHLDDAEGNAQEARTLALGAGLGHELGEASTLLALISFARGTWHDVFRQEFTAAMGEGDPLAMAVYDAHLCFAEYYMYGADGPEGAESYAKELLAAAVAAESPPAQALSRLLLGEILLSQGRLEEAEGELALARELYADTGVPSGQSVVLERLAEIEIIRARPALARQFMEQALPLAEASGIPTHLVVRVFGVRVAASEGTEALEVLEEAERRLRHLHVCELCSMGFLVGAARAGARGGDLERARRYLAEAERVSLMWQGGPWAAAVWEVRGEVRAAEGDAAQAAAFFREAADQFDAARRPLDAARCRARLRETEPALHA